LIVTLISTLIEIQLQTQIHSLIQILILIRIQQEKGQEMPKIIDLKNIFCLTFEIVLMEIFLINKNVIYLENVL
jgi:hypothetical protein